MKTTRTLLVALAALALPAAACGRLTGAGDGGGIDHPTGADELVLRVDVGGGFVPLEYAAKQLPAWSLFGDGSLITQGPQIEIYPGPALPNLLVQTISEDGIQAILEAARDAGLLGGDRSYDYGCVMDAPTTTFTAVADGRRNVVSAYALGLEGGECPGVDTRARTKLMDFWTRLGDLRGWLPAGSVGEEQPFVFDEVRIFVKPHAGAPDQGLEHPEIGWPLSGSLADFGATDATFSEMRCGTVSGADLATLLPDLRRANELTPWTSGGEEYRLILRPLLPDEDGC